MSAVKGADEPMAASVESAPVISAACEARWARNRPASASAVAAGQALATEEGFAFAHHDGGEMGEGCEIAGGADGALFRDQRHDALFQHGLDQPYQLQPHARSAAPERDQLQRHDQAHDVFRQGSADAAAMRQDEVALQGGGVGGVDLDRG
jgi:hypothetical protein